MSRPVRLASRAQWLLLVAAGCGSREHTAAADGGAPNDDTCAVVEHVEVPLDPFGALSDPPKLVPFGDRFGVIDGDSITPDKVANVALVSWHGVAGQTQFELSELCPDGACRNIHGTALLATPAGAPEFVLAEQGSSVSMAAYPLRALAWDSDGSPAQITPLFDTRVTAITTRADLQSSRNAERALFVLGNIDMPALQAVEIGANATLVAPPATMPLPGTPWDCVRVVPTDAAGALSAVTKLDGGASVVWSVRELDADANVVFAASATVPVGDALGFTDCPQVLESAEGFHAQWLGTSGDAVVATVPRAEPDAPAEVLYLEESPGALAGVLHGELVLLTTLDDGRQAYVRVTRDGNAGGAGVTLPLLPPSTSERRRAPPQALVVTDSTLTVSYELESARVFEKWSCP
jgi:hypothetical protein